MSSETIYPALSHAQITLRGVDVTLGTTPVLHHVDLAVTATSCIAVMGENGRGKTTLLHVLIGQVTPDAGSIARHGTIGMAEQDMTIDDNRTVGDAIAETIAPAVAALTEFEAASLALAEEQPGAEKLFTGALERAGALCAWDAERRVQLAIEALDAETDYVTGWRPPKGSGKHRRATRASSTVHNVQRRQASLEAHTLSIPEPPLVLNFPVTF